ncbi:2-oxo acid dehydrogenase subunit E2 [Desulfofundulus thermosubterraneus]|uniref:Dihydrolipoamide acetyltransferase component of pyruvate dehydrogenase complex n=1 Tax=Desulfofundulus thermosubterraneus DSM 16057 TaxID=1121432 RepID=A0A1M6GKR0_9FIRM|nr:2-oxo acid dehydrogenase subunit E2 [Desulfofundulus thermosubterraneus]SHJ10531.1 pyruvate dehydrogenase E2 component (dihydrolipoamide acetyltransferase) [Desulfofundulus thermosubterraneus DSM 16057]
MANIVLMPKLGLTMKKGRITGWLKNEGDRVEQGEPLLEVMTEKVNVRVESPFTGVLYKILCPAGSTLPVSVPVAVIADEGDDEASLEAAVSEALAALQEALAGGGKEEERKKEARPVKPFVVFAGERKVSPRAARLARKEGVDIGLISGSGPGGRVVEEDVRNYLEQLKGGQSYQVLPIDGMRAVIAERMSASRKQAAHVTIMEEVDVTALRDVREQLNAQDSSGRIKFSYTDLLVKFTAEALTEFPMVNSRSSENEIFLPGSVNIGVAVALENGLVVPNIKNAHQLSLEQISTKVKDLATRARNNELDPEDVENGTFTISNLGMFGAEGFTPIINRPETAILGVGTIRTKPALVDGRLEKRYFMTLSLSFDHRIIDGSLAAEFLSRLKEMLEDPYPWFGLQPQKNEDLLISAGGGKSPRQIRRAYKDGINRLMETAPDVVMGFSALTEGIFFDDGAVSRLNKELIAVALSVYIKCEYCITAHIYKAMELGATPEQILEAANVAVFFGGGAALAYTATLVQDCIEAFGGN